MKNGVRRLNLYWLFLTLLIAVAVITTACSSTSSNTSLPVTSAPVTSAIPQQSTLDRGSGLPQIQRTAGTIAGIGNNNLTLTTTQGQVTININSNTSIQKTEDGKPDDLQSGTFITVMGNQIDDNTITGTSIMIRPQSDITSPALPSGMAPGPGANLIPTNGAGRPNNFGGGVMGTLSRIDGNTLTLTNKQGTITVNIDGNTRIQKTVSLAISDLRAGESVSVFGDQDANGNINAASVIIGQAGQINLPGAGGNPPTPPTN